jgi:glycosyltransferase involved in cell wall biosynthesis
MKILYHHRTQGAGGEGVHIRGMVEAFRKLGHEVTVVSPPGIDPFREEGPNASNKSGLAKTWKWISGHLPEICFELLELAYNFIAYKNIKEAIKKEEIDFIYERYAFFCFAGVRLAKKYNIPIVLEVNEISGIKRVRGQALVNLAKKIEKWIFNKADTIVTVSSFLKTRVEGRGIDSGKIYIIPNAVNIERFNADTNGIEIRNRFNLSGKTVLGFAGWFAWWDNLELLVNTLSEMVKEKANLHLVLIGDGDKRRGLEREAVKRGVNNNITFAGKVSRRQMPDFIQAIDICVIPHSNPFGSPVVLFEYMAMGKAVVAPRLGPIEDVITDGVNGVLFEPKDEGSLKRYLLDLINDSHRREKIGKEARDAVLSKHLWRHSAERVVQIYNGVAGKC